MKNWNPFTHAAVSLIRCCAVNCRQLVIRGLTAHCTFADVRRNLWTLVVIRRTRLARRAG